MLSYIWDFYSAVLYMLCTSFRLSSVSCFCFCFGFSFNCHHNRDFNPFSSLLIQSQHIQSHHISLILRIYRYRQVSYPPFLPTSSNIKHLFDALPPAPLIRTPRAALDQTLLIRIRHGPPLAHLGVFSHLLHVPCVVIAYVFE